MLEAALHDANFDPAIQGTGLRVLERAFNECEVRLGRPATNLEVCRELGLNLRELYVLLDSNRGVGLGRVADCAPDEGNGEALVRYFPDPADEETFCICSKSEFDRTMARSLESLPKNEKLVVSLHHNEDLSLEEIARIFGISEARVAQIHTTAMLRIRSKLQSLDGN